MGIIRVGVVGAGWIAPEHQRVLDSVAEAQLVAVCDLDVGRAAELAAGTDARVYQDWHDLLDREDLGALLVCTPPRFHHGTRPPRSRWPPRPSGPWRRPGQSRSSPSKSARQ